jgi:hypothetical protein
VNVVVAEPGSKTESCTETIKELFCCMPGISAGVKLIINGAATLEVI